MEWKPIETAPKDGTEVLVYRNGEKVVRRVAVAMWHPVSGWVVSASTVPIKSVSHWMPLPPPPSEQ